MKSPSKGEELFLLHCKAYSLSPVREFQFTPPRKWRADFCFPDAMLLVEIDGGTWNFGRHTRHHGVTADIERSNRAQLMGYCCLRFTTDQVESGYAIDLVREALCKRTGNPA